MSFLDSDKNYVYDVESAPNFFSCVVKHMKSGQRWIFETSDRANNSPEFVDFIHALRYHDCRMIGFNNFYYDWQVVEHLMSVGTTFIADDAFRKTDMIINGCGVCHKCQTGNSFKCETNFKSTVWGKDQLVKQIDLYLIHHFDNFAKSTSLKELEFNMRSSNVGDLPFEPGKPIPEAGMETTLVYNCHDVDETERFAIHSAPMIEFREELIPSMGYDVMNYNDTKIGKKFFELELKKRAPHLLGTNNNKKQTKRDFINISDVIIPSIQFQTTSLQGMLNYLKNTTITKTKAPPELKDLSAKIGEFIVDVGAGGGHGSVERQLVKPEPGWKLIDVDVASYYPNLAIANRFFPAHLSETFCDIYEDVYKRRKATKKKTAPNEMYKLALNGVYGDSANQHSIFLDPQYTMQITINGQLLLYLLTELITVNTKARMVQLNTDGITFLVPENEEPVIKEICKWWEDYTKLDLEFAEYEAMWIRDVNNYVAKSVDGYVKRIGAYAFETQRENPGTREVKWSKDHSALVVQKAACACMIDGVSVRDFIMNHDDAYDFLLRSKISGKQRQRILMEGQTDTPPTPEVNEMNELVGHFDKDNKFIQHMVFNPDAGAWQQKMTRYYIAKNGGGQLQVIHPPAPSAKQRKSKRVIGKHIGWKVFECNDIQGFDTSNIEYEWYIQEAEKLVIR